MRLSTIRLQYVFTLIAVPFLIAATNNGCDDSPATTTAGTRTAIQQDNITLAHAQEFQFNGHMYLMVTFSGEGGGALCHAEDCPCKTKTSMENEKH